MYRQISNVEFDSMRSKQELNIIDARDQQSFDEGHIPGANHITMENLNTFIGNTDKVTPVVIYCYHGVVSQSVAQLMVEEGFESVFSLIGGYESWQNDHSSE